VGKSICQHMGQVGPQAKCIKLNWKHRKTSKSIAMSFKIMNFYKLHKEFGWTYSYDGLYIPFISTDWGYLFFLCLFLIHWRLGLYISHKLWHINYIAFGVSFEMRLLKNSLTAAC
jgi:hypothetical protein